MEALGDDELILFLDECCVHHAPTKIRMWAPKGQPPVIKTPGGKQKKNITGAVDPKNGKVHAAFHEKLNATGFLRYLKRLLFRHDDLKKLYVVLDNARIHHAKLLKPFLDRVKHKLELIFLPPYSPDLNPTELFWKYLRRTVTHNTFYEKFDDFEHTLRDFLEKCKTGLTEVISLCQFS